MTVKDGCLAEAVAAEDGHQVVMEENGRNKGSGGGAMLTENCRFKYSE